MPIVIGHDPDPGALLQLQYQMGLQEQFNNQQSRDLRAVQEAGNITQQQQQDQERAREFDVTTSDKQQQNAARQQYDQGRLGIESAQLQQRPGSPTSTAAMAALNVIEQAHNNGTLDDDSYNSAKINLAAGRNITSPSGMTAQQNADANTQRAQQAVDNARQTMINHEIGQTTQSVTAEVKAAEATVKSLGVAGQWTNPQAYAAAQMALQAAYAKLANVSDSVKAKYAQSPGGTSAPTTQPAAAASGTASGAMGVVPQPGTPLGNSAYGSAQSGPAATGTVGQAPAAPTLRPIPQSIKTQFLTQNGNDPNAAQAAAKAAGYDPTQIVPG